MKQHLSNQEENSVQAYTLDHDDTVNGLLKDLKNILKNNNVNPEQVSSFNTKENTKAQAILKDQDSLVENVDFEKFENLIQNLGQEPIVKSLIFYFDSADQRILQETTGEVTPTFSPMFLNMNPSTLSGLLVGLFLIVVLLIGVSCLYDIKTNDKFARQNLWVGK